MAAILKSQTRPRKPYSDFIGVAILGDTGVGKSTLVNVILEAQTAKTGIGRPVTKMVETHIHPDKKLILHDFEGFHHGSATSTKNMKKLFMNLRGRGLPIDVVWFCWSASSHRVTQGQHARISEVQRMGIPVIGVLTKARVRAGQLHPNDRAFARVIEAEQLDLSEPSVYITSSVQDQAGEFEVGGHEILLQATTSLVVANRISSEFAGRRLRPGWAAGVPKRNRR